MVEWMKSSDLRIHCTDKPVLQNYVMHYAIEPAYSAPEQMSANIYIAK